MSNTKSSAYPPADMTYLRFNGALGKIENLFNLIAATSILVLMLMAVVQVIGRNLFNQPVPGFIDITEQAMAVFAFMGIAYCQRVGGHIRMELVIGVFKGRSQWISEFLGVLIILVVVSVLAYGSFVHFSRSWNLGDSTIDIGLATWPSKIVVPVALSLLWLRLVLQLFGYARLIVNPSASVLDLPHVMDAAEHAKAEIEETFHSAENEAEKTAMATPVHGGAS
ncbi:TRAP transporter small permease [Pseudovibrio sp. Tun.PSC04-5.I4]|uniref:TRAP transporter small permease subunit n=1 Tax=Pseudovibrio sp. Tun.PSC04-5.I4 TaxID=1798213 RepID=UPI0008891391|nr:TRAP transporter small permease [Pseudovibrio sp. Tun.PSC04-5.I4]SDQ77467.1 TRAP-type mannitol/chloroaromatic compound transport system, small permease component [Pseudovibrio sp. Tun.PSC04-5.I4]